MALNPVKPPSSLLASVTNTTVRASPDDMTENDRRFSPQYVPITGLEGSGPSSTYFFLKIYYSKLSEMLAAGLKLSVAPDLKKIADFFFRPAASDMSIIMRL